MNIKDKQDKKHLYVFLRGKIIGTDTVMPLCMQLYKECNFTFTFVLFDHESYQAIKNDNIVLYDAINLIGKLTSFSSSKYENRMASKIVSIFRIIKIIFNINFKNSYIMHSGGLNEKPLSFIANFLPLKKIIFNERSHIGMRSSYSAIQYPDHFYSCRQNQDEFNKNNIGNPPKMYGGILIGFDKLWNYFKHPGAENSKKIVFDDSRNAGYWVDFIESRASNYIDRELDENMIDQKDRHIIIVFIGRLQLDKTGQVVESFIQMINEIAKNIGDKYPVFIKPHIFSDLDFLEKCILDGIGEYKMKYILTKLHPSVLASRAAMSFFVGNSTVISEISNLKVPIIQCLYGFDDKGVLAKTSDKANYVMTKKDGDLSKIINKLVLAKHSPVVFTKRKNNIDCSFFNSF